MPPMIRRLRPFACLLPLLVPVSAAKSAPLEFRVTFDRSVSAQPFSGRVYVMLFKQDVKDLRPGPDWFRPEPFFAKDVKNWQPGQPLVFGGDALAFPVAMAKVHKATYSIQAVMDFDRGARSFSTADGNAHGKSVRRELDGAASGPVELTIDQVYKSKPFVETERVKLVDIESKLLMLFTGARPICEPASCCRVRSGPSRNDAIRSSTRSPDSAATTSAPTPSPHATGPTWPALR